MSLEEKWKNEMENHAGDYSGESNETDLFAAYKAGYMTKHNNCIDKQKVKSALTHLKEKMADDWVLIEEDMIQFEKELGLD